MNERRSDFELLRDYVRHGDQPAFASVVRQHVNLVYGTALRKVEHPEAAQEVAQNVFTTLARKAWRFAPDDSLPAWLYRTTLLEAKEWWRGELRRRRREQTAAELGTTMKTPDDQPALRSLVPLLDDALLSLPEKDRIALLLRFFESRSLRDVGASLGVNEDTAQKRVAGALERLTQFFRRRGFRTVSTAVAAAALQQTATSAPAMVVSALTQAAAPAAIPFGLAVVATRLASLSKLQLATVCVALTALPVSWSLNKFQAARDETAFSRRRLEAVQNEYSRVQEDIQRWRENSIRLENSLTEAAALAQRRTQLAAQREDWKNRLRGSLFNNNFVWPEDSPFVRIPKSVLARIEMSEPVLPPGTVKQSARELLGLTPDERQAIEAALQRHFRAVDEMIDAGLNRSSGHETNLNASYKIPKSALASTTWTIPALGEDIKKQGLELKASLENVLGAQRWRLVEPLFEPGGNYSVARILNLASADTPQRISVWVLEENGKLVAGVGYAGNYLSFSHGNVSLDLFLPGAEARYQMPPGADALNLLDARKFPDAITRRMRDWFQYQALSRLETESNR